MHRGVFRNDYGPFKQSNGGSEKRASDDKQEGGLDAYVPYGDMTK